LSQIILVLQFDKGNNSSQYKVCKDDIFNNVCIFMVTITRPREMLGWLYLLLFSGGCRGRVRMVVGFTTTYAINAYHHEWSGRGVQHYVIKFVSDLRQVGGFPRVLRFPPPIKLTPRYNWNIVESGVKHHQTNKQTFFSGVQETYDF
jgi:hypothetical protein